MRKPDLDDFFKSESYVEEDDNPAEEESIPDRGIPHTPTGFDFREYQKMLLKNGLSTNIAEYSIWLPERERHIRD